MDGVVLPSSIAKTYHAWSTPSIPPPFLALTQFELVLSQHLHQPNSKYCRDAVWHICNTVCQCWAHLDQALSTIVFTGACS